MSSATSIPDWVVEIRRLADQASPAPWFVGFADDEAFMSAQYVTTQAAPSRGWPPEVNVVAITSLQMPRYAGSERADENSRFIVAARHDVPRLCSALEGALDERAALADALRDLLATAGLPTSAIERAEAIRRGQRLLTDLAAAEGASPPGTG